MKFSVFWTLMVSLLFTFFLTSTTQAEINNQADTSNTFVQAISDTPVFYTSAIDSIFWGITGTELLLDEYGQIDPLEFVAFSGTVFSVKKTIPHGSYSIYQVTTDAYPYTNKTGYFIDSRFTKATSLTGSLKRTFPSRTEIIWNLKNMVGLPYIWGGNAPNGIKEMLEYYGPRGIANESLRSKWTLRWVDCSGLLYSATNGNTPRNTSSLINYGKAIAISGLSESQIVAKLKPLDLIVWNGHTKIVLQNGKIIESRAAFSETWASGFEGGGVLIRDTKTVVKELLESRTPVNSWEDTVPEGVKKFVVRRWYGNIK